MSCDDRARFGPTPSGLFCFCPYLPFFIFSSSSCCFAPGGWALDPRVEGVFLPRKTDSWAKSQEGGEKAVGRAVEVSTFGGPSYRCVAGLDGMPGSASIFKSACDLEPQMGSSQGRWSRHQSSRKERSLSAEGGGEGVCGGKGRDGKWGSRRECVW